MTLIKELQIKIAMSNYYKKSLYFDRNIEVKSSFNKLVKICGNEDKVDEINFNYRLLKNIHFKELNNVIPIIENQKKTF